MVFFKPLKLDREKFSIYIRGLQESVDRKAMTEVFSKFGQIVKCDIIASRVISFFLKIARISHLLNLQRLKLLQALLGLKYL